MDILHIVCTEKQNQFYAKSLICEIIQNHNLKVDIKTSNNYEEYHKDIKSLKNVEILRLEDDRVITPKSYARLLISDLFFTKDKIFQIKNLMHELGHFFTNIKTSLIKMRSLKKKKLREWRKNFKEINFKFNPKKLFQFYSIPQEIFAEEWANKKDCEHVKFMVSKMTFNLEIVDNLDFYLIRYYQFLIYHSLYQRNMIHEKIYSDICKSIEKIKNKISLNFDYKLFEENLINFINSEDDIDLITYFQSVDQMTKMIIEEC